MLSDHEQQVLHELERRLMVGDPEFARSFQAREQRLPGGRYRRVAEAAIVVGVLLSALMLVAGSPGGALALAAATVLFWAWRYSGGPNSGGRDGACHGPF